MLVGVAFLPLSFPPSGTQAFYIINRQNCVNICNTVYTKVTRFEVFHLYYMINRCFDITNHNSSSHSHSTQYQFLPCASLLFCHQQDIDNYLEGMPFLHLYQNLNMKKSTNDLLRQPSKYSCCLPLAYKILEVGLIRTQKHTSHFQK